jgi:hypothetical protein
MATLREVQVTFDCADPPRVARFWCEVLGYELDPDVAEGGDWAACADPTGKGPRFFFQQVPEEKRVKNRVHVDVRAGTGLAAPSDRPPSRPRATVWSSSAPRGYSCSWLMTSTSPAW